MAICAKFIGCRLTKIFMEIKPEISFEDFAKIDLRVGTIISADQIDESEKLVKLIVDLGSDTKRQILAGIKKFYPVEDLVGRQIVIVANLAARQMMSYQSEGMLLAANDELGQPVILQVEKSVPNGSSIK